MTDQVYSEEQANTYTASTQDNPEIAVLAGGSYVIVWDSEGQDGAGTGVYGQSFSASGVPLGPEFRINGATSTTQNDAHIAATRDGGFIVTWTDASGVDGSGQGVIGQRFDASWVAQGANFVVNTSTVSTQNSSSVAGYTGGFAVVWMADGSSIAGSSSGDIYIRRFDNAGNQVTAETRVSTVPGAGTAQTGTQTTPDIAADLRKNQTEMFGYL
ncbi:MAG: hypothetical protein EXR36_09090 [Betaproteobacteria bacterium]|nr:hypothetical protein [Betaproteobacteria bacterium]